MRNEPKPAIGATRRAGLAAGAALAALLAAGPALAHDFRAGSIEVEHPWSRATPAGAKVAAGYLAIGNSGDAPDRLLSASAEIAGRAEIHEMAVKDGVMTMRQLPNGVEIPAKGEAKFAPGGLHLMFMELKRPPKQGESFAGSLTFEKAGTVKVEFSVEPLGATGPSGKAMDHGNHGDHGEMKK